MSINLKPSGGFLWRDPVFLSIALTAALLFAFPLWFMVTSAFKAEPEIQAIETETNQYATANRAAKAFIDPKMLNDPALFVPDDILAKLEGQGDNSAVTQRADIYEEFKSKIGQG